MFALLVFYGWGRRKGMVILCNACFLRRMKSTRSKRHCGLQLLGWLFLLWPWIVVGLGSIVILPISEASPALTTDPELIYPMMINAVLPEGLKGLLVAAFMAAFMSTVDTHLCWGGSYMVNDIYKRFINTKANDSHYLFVSRLSIVILMLLSAVACMANG